MPADLYITRRPAACPRDPESLRCRSGSRGQAAGRRGYGTRDDRFLKFKKG